MKRRRHLSRAHRAAIARGLRKFWRGERRKVARRKAQRKLRRQQQRLPTRLPKREMVEWEVTLRYSVKRRAVGWTARVIAPAWATREQVIYATKRSGQGHDEKGFAVHWMNWQAELHGRMKTYPAYDPQDVLGWTALFNAADERGEVRAEKPRE